MPNVKDGKSVGPVVVEQVQPMANQPDEVGIYWPSWSNLAGAAVDSPHVPSDEEIRFRHDGQPGTHARSPTFEAAVVCANVRVWILDMYAHDNQGIAVFRRWMKGLRARSIRVVSSQLPASLVELQPASSNVAFEWRQLRWQMARLIHDRFAIVDDELWHFGATVGGGHESVNAFTRGFHAVNTGMIDFFDRVIWRRWSVPCGG